MNQEKENISFTFRLLKTILQNIKFLVIFNFIVAVIAVIFLLIMDKEYKSSILFSVESEAGTAQISTLLQQLPVNFGSHGGATPDRFIRLATSRTVLDSIINAFDLINYYEQEFRETTYDAVKGNLGLIDNGDGTITLSYISPDPQLSADIANKFFEMIKKLDVEISASRAHSFRKFLEARYQETVNKLTVYEDSLKDFSEDTKLIAVEEQISQSLEMLTQMELKKLELEIRKEFIESTSSKENVAYERVLEEIRAIEDKISEIKTEEIHSNIPLNSIPKRALQYFRLRRKVEIQEKIFEFLVPQLEKARIDEKKNFTNLILIDKAIPAELKARPKRTQLFIITMFFSGVFSLLIAKLRDMYLENKEDLRTLLKKK